MLPRASQPRLRPRPSRLPVRSTAQGIGLPRLRVCPRNGCRSPFLITGNWDSFGVARGHTMKLPRRSFLHLAAGVAALPAVSRIARAQAYPSRPVRIVVGFAAGGSNDTLARLIGSWLSERLGQPFIVETRPGAGGNIATEVVVNAPPDGHTL